MVSHMNAINGRAGWAPKINIVQNICRGLNIRADQHPIALKTISALVNSDIRQLPTGLVKPDKVDALTRSMHDAPELKEFTHKYTSEDLKEMLDHLEIIAPAGSEDLAVASEIEALKILLHAEDKETDNLTNAAIILYASSLLREANTPAEVVSIVNLFQRYLPQAVSEFGVDFLGILINQAEVAKTNLERHLELSIKDQLSVMRGEKDLIHRLLHILTWTGVNRACFFGPMADGFMAIGSVSRAEHEGKVRDLPENVDPTELIEKPGEFDPHEDEPLNVQIRSLSLPVFLPEFPILVEKGSVHRVSEEGDKIELKFNENLEAYFFARAIQEGLKFDGREVDTFLLAPVKNGSLLGFIYIDNAYDNSPIEYGELIKRVNYTGPIIDSAQKREREKNDKMIGSLLTDWLKDYTGVVLPRGGKNSDVRRGYQVTYRDNVLRKEGAEFKRKVYLRRVIEESVKRFIPHDNGDIKIKIHDSIPDFYYQPYHLQGIMDGLIMNAVWSHSINKKQGLKITIDCRIRSGKLVVRVTSAGAKMDFQGVHDWENLDLGTAIVLESLDIKLADPQSELQSHGDLKILDPTSSHGPGLEVSLNDVEFLAP